MENKKAIGAFWKKMSAKGTVFYSGIIEVEGKKIPLVMFENRKQKDTQPDLQVYLSEPKKQEAKVAVEVKDIVF